MRPRNGSRSRPGPAVAALGHARAPARGTATLPCCRWRPATAENGEPGPDPAAARDSAGRQRLLLDLRHQLVERLTGLAALVEEQLRSTRAPLEEALERCLEGLRLAGPELRPRDARVERAIEDHRADPVREPVRVHRPDERPVREAEVARASRRRRRPGSGRGPGRRPRWTGTGGSRRSARRRRPRTRATGRSAPGAPRRRRATGRCRRGRSRSSMQRTGLLELTPRGSKPTRSNRSRMALRELLAPSRTKSTPEPPGPPGLTISEPIRAPSVRGGQADERQVEHARRRVGVVLRDLDRGALEALAAVGPAGLRRSAAGWARRHGAWDRRAARVRARVRVRLASTTAVAGADGGTVGPTAGDDQDDRHERGGSGAADPVVRGHASRRIAEAVHRRTDPKVDPRDTASARSPVEVHRCGVEPESGRRSGRPAAASARSRRAGRAFAGAKTAAGGPSATTSPGAHDDDPREVGRRELHVVGDRDDRPSGRRDRLDDRADPLDAVGVLAGRRLVEDEDRRVHRQDAGQRDELAPREVEVVRVRRRGRRSGRRPRGCASTERGDLGRPDARGCAGRTRPRARPTARRAGRRGSGRRTRPSPRARATDRSAVGAVEQDPARRPGAGAR